MLFPPLDRNEGLVLSVLSIPSGWGHPLGQVYFPFPLDLDRRITLAFGFCAFRWAPGSGACACRLFLGWASSFTSVLLFSSLCGFILLCRFPFLGIFPCLDLLAFSPPFLLWLSLVLVTRCFLGPSLPLESHFAIWLVLRSLSGLLCSFGLAPFSFWLGRSFPLSRVFYYWY